MDRHEDLLPLRHHFSATGQAFSLVRQDLFAFSQAFVARRGELLETR